MSLKLLFSNDRMDIFQDISNLSNQMLIALPTLENSIFDKSVSLVCRHDKKGAMGLMFNKISDYSLHDIFSNLNIEPKCDIYLNEPVFEGGPIHGNRGFVMHSPLGNWERTLRVSDDVGITSSKDILLAIANGNPPDYFLVTLGCAGWDEGQLERELIDNAWLIAPADNDILFDKHFDKKWQASADKIGVDLFKINQILGHA